jgi:hypothetical protein
LPQAFDIDLQSGASVFAVWLSAEIAAKRQGVSLQSLCGQWNLAANDSHPQGMPISQPNQTVCQVFPGRVHVIARPHR